MDVDGAVQAIEAALDGEDFEQALCLASEAVREFPTDLDVQVLYGQALWALGDLQDAREAYREATRLAPETAGIWADVACLHFELAEFEQAREAAERSIALEESAETLDLMCKLAEREGCLKEADAFARRAQALDPENFPLPLRVGEADFQSLVRDALDGIPPKFREALEGDVAILVEPVPPEQVLKLESPPLDPELLGLYVGTPLPEREDSTAQVRLPDRIYLFQRNLEHDVETPEDLVEQIGITLFHEVGHYLGFTDEELEERDFG
ncbi:MAG: metallopeptidase family protein [Candidatus Krumholzibacteriia bacterium]